MTTPLLSLTTTIAPAQKFLLDEAEFEFLTLEHLGKEDEAYVTALFAQLERLQERLSIETKLESATNVAKRIKATRVSLLERLTSVPLEKLNAAPTPVQVRLLEEASDAMMSSFDEEEEIGSDDGDVD